MATIKRKAKALDAVGTKIYHAYKQGSIDGDLYGQLVAAGMTDRRHDEDSALEEDLGHSWATPLYRQPRQVEVIEDCIPKEPPSRYDVLSPEPTPVEEMSRVTLTPSSPIHPPQDEGIEKESTANRDEEDENVKHVSNAGWCMTWCFRCCRNDEFVFRDGKLPDCLEFDGDKEKPLIIPICCSECNHECQQPGSNREEEEERIRDSFAYLKFGWDSLSSEAKEMAKARIGQDVALFTCAGKVAHVDVDRIRRCLVRGDLVETLNTEKFRKGERSELGLGKLAGGLF